MNIVMLKTTNGCNDGIISKTYEEGKSYEVSESLGKCFLEMNVAEEEQKNNERKSLDSDDYQNKAVKPKLNKGEGK